MAQTQLSLFSFLILRSLPYTLYTGGNGIGIKSLCAVSNICLVYYLISYVLAPNSYLILSPLASENRVINTYTRTDRQTDRQTDYRYPPCACAARVNNIPLLHACSRLLTCLCCTGPMHRIKTQECQKCCGIYII